MSYEVEIVEVGVHRVSFEAAHEYARDILGKNKRILGFEGAWYFDNGAVQPVGDLIGVLDDDSKAEQFLEGLFLALEKPLVEYEKKKAQGKANLKVEFTIVDEA